MLRIATVFTLFTIACGAQKEVRVDDADLDDSVASQESDVSTSWQTITLDAPVQSRHPYFDDESIVQNVWATTCASEFQVHFSAFELETKYDFLSVEQRDGALVSRHTGKKSSLWSKTIKGSLGQVRLDSDESIVKKGFFIDKIRFHPGAYMVCPAVLTKVCDPGLIDVTAQRDPCKCPAYTPTCVDQKSVSVTFTMERGAIQGHKNVLRMDGEGNVYEQINIPVSRPGRLRGTVDPGALRDFVWALENEHFFENTYAQADRFVSETFRAEAGGRANEKTIASQFQPGDNPFVDQWKHLIRCDGSLVCAAGTTCQADGNCL